MNAPPVTTLTLECSSCGATLNVEPQFRTHECPYCDTPGVVERPPTANRPVPTFVVGFVLTGGAAAEQVGEWVKSRGLFAHGGLKTASVETVRGVYLPGYLYGATAHATYSAEIGENYTVTETYTTTDSEGKTVTRTRTRTETEWRSLAGEYASYVQDVVVTASRAIGNDELEEIEPFDLGALRRYDHGMVAGWIAEEPSRSRGECQQLAEQEAMAAVGQRIARFLPGDSQTNVRFSTQLRDQVLELLYLPIWVFSANYAPDKPPVRVLVNGQTGKVYGKVPLSPLKIAIAVILGLVLVAGVVLAVMDVPVSTLLAPCARCQSPLEQGDLRCAICAETAPHTEVAGAERVRLSILRCQGCGAAVTYDPEHQAPACGFCDSVLEVEELADPLEQTELYLPFTASPALADAALRAWWGNQGFFRVQDLPERAQVDSLTPLWWVGWLFTAEALISWTADSNAGSRRSAWAPHAGQSPMRFENILVSASRGLTRSETHALIPGYDLRTAREQPEGGPQDAVVEAFDVQRSGARARIAQGIEEYAMARVAGECVPGSTYRNLHVTSLLRGLVTRRYAFPAYVMAYRYKAKLYRVVICGQNPQVLTGESPISITRVLLAVVGVTFLIAILLAVVAAAAS